MIYLDIFSNEVNFVKKIRKPFKILRLFTENKKIFEKRKEQKFKVYLINRFNQLFRLKYKKPELAISYGFSLIFNKTIISEYKKGIWNIHPGDLPKYRGRHPITVAFLKNEKKIGVSVHSIDQTIDRGQLLAKKFVTRTYKDDENSIKKKILKEIPNLLNKSFQNYIANKTKKLSKGKYYKPFYNGIILNDPKKFSKIYIYNAIKAQKSYGGILINGERFTDVKFYNKKYLKNKSFKTLVCKGSKKLVVKK